MTREAIYAALFAHLADLPGVVTASRSLRHWDEVPSSEQPALFVAQGDQTADGGRASGGAAVAAPTEWTLTVDLYLYVHEATCSAPLVHAALNDLLDAIETRLKPGPGQLVQTLGGLVRDVRISGVVETDGGVLGPQAFAVLPLVLLPR